MANADRALEYPGLQTDPTVGGGIQNTAYSEWIKIRATADGVVENAAVDCDTLVTGGFINIRNCSVLTIAAQFVDGSLTSAAINPQFSDDKVLFFLGGVFDTLVTTTQTVGIVNVVGMNYQLEADTNVIFSIQNPGAKWVKFQTTSVGTTTTSSLAMWVCRGWATVSPFYS